MGFAKRKSINDIIRASVKQTIEEWKSTILGVASKPARQKSKT